MVEVVITSLMQGTNVRLCLPVLVCANSGTSVDVNTTYEVLLVS
jgi:hypothetical protein